MQTPSYRKHALILGIVLGIVFVSCLILLFLFPSMQKDGNLIAHIYQNGEIVQTIPLDSVKEDYSLTLGDENGTYNIIQIRPGSIGITDASCPDKLCVHMGFQKTTLLPITCLPNNVVIRIERGNNSHDAITGTGLSNGTDNDLDGVTY